MSTAPAPGGQVIAQLRGEQRSKAAANASFFRMLRIVRPHWRILTLGLLLSLGVALTYAGTLVGILPVLKVLVEQQNLNTYLLEQADKLEAMETWQAGWAGVVRWGAGWFPAKSDGAQMRTLMMLIGGLIGLNLIGNTLRFLSQYFILYGCNRSLMDLRRFMYRQALRMPLLELSGDMSKMISQFLSDVREVYLGMVILFGRVAREPLKAIAVLAAALVLDARLTLVVLAIMPPTVGLLWFFGRKIRKADGSLAARLWPDAGRARGIAARARRGQELCSRGTRAETHVAARTQDAEAPESSGAG
jgi:ABC-type multidrug transport system fused ATPase/permease subunit